jgi:hypothetical protein
VDEKRLIEKLRAIEALFAGATTDGERVAAQEARGRIRRRLQETSQAEPSIEHRFKLADDWSRRVFLALLRRYGISPYRYRRQRRTTVMARAPKRFVDETLWPEFEQVSSTLRSHLQDITDRIVAEVIHGDISEAAECEPESLPPAAR